MIPRRCWWLFLVALLSAATVVAQGEAATPEPPDESWLEISALMAKNVRDAVDDGRGRKEEDVF